MAKQAGPHFITGTIGGLCYYKLNGQYYVRAKSSLSRKRVKHSPKFERTMRNAGLFGRASKLAHIVYRQILPWQQQRVQTYRAILKKAISMLRAEMDIEEVRAILVNEYVLPRQVAPVVGVKVIKTTTVQPARQERPKPVRPCKRIPLFSTGRAVQRRRQGIRVLKKVVSCAPSLRGAAPGLVGSGGPKQSPAIREIASAASSRGAGARGLAMTGMEDLAMTARN